MCSNAQFPENYSSRPSMSTAASSMVLNEVDASTATPMVKLCQTRASATCRADRAKRTAHGDAVSIFGRSCKTDARLYVSIADARHDHVGIQTLAHASVSRTGGEQEHPHQTWLFIPPSNHLARSYQDLKDKTPLETDTHLLMGRSLSSSDI